ncbi:endonuclease/exonuclease/phosphatase family protein [Alcanivorax sp. S6407]|uniref:endonuclease/exonuclease/phosphatase family protein n=1 Tax=Alcanivorax sp. S6407 TaxID=2926424 RepID=UPI001FF6E776|nr:endonuclease/exonuclease/phosphatase family protein [Alcanivorax sp. S6407]MCK0153236.1 endonuclease/exonuclease/phosphatase family protein [Alcanivorax sp. S6407]
MRLTYCILILFLCIGASPLQAECRNLAAPRAVMAPADNQWTLATLNLWRLRDARKDSDLDEPLSSSLLARRLDAIANAVVNDLHAPHLLAVQEVENLALLETLANRLAQSGFRYRTVLLEGNDPSGMDVGLLYRAPIALTQSRALFAKETFQGYPLFSRPPLAVSLQSPVQADLVVVHLRSARDLKSSRVFEKRRHQASRLAGWVAEQSGPVIVAGDFNSTWDAGRFSDSYQQFAASGLFNVWQKLAPAERYSYRYRCRPQALDHIWLSAELASRVDAVDVSRGSAGRYRKLYGSEGISPISDHDALVVYFDRQTLEAR